MPGYVALYCNGKPAGVIFLILDIVACDLKNNMFTKYIEKIFFQIGE